MKKILIPTILTISSTPLISLGACKERNKERIVFSVDESTMDEPTVDYVQLSWTRSGDEISFNNFNFTSSQGNATVTYSQPITNPLSLTLTFSSEVTEDINDGVLSFHFEDATLGIVNDYQISRIHITKYSPPVARDFNTDSWNTVGHYARNGLNALTSAYSDWLSSHDNTFIGATRKVKFNSLQYDVIVIGTNEDFLDEQHQQPVALTFQFVDILSNENEKQIKTLWAESEEQATNYWNAVLHNFLSETIYPKILSENPDLENQLKFVDRAVNTKNGESWEPKHNKEYIFITSAKDIKSYGTNKPYSWWEKHQEDNDRIKHDKSGDNCHWWLSTLYEDTRIWINAVTNTGATPSFGVENAFGIAPCFCI